MNTILKQYLLSLMVFLGLDAIWLGLISKDIYSQYLGHLMKNPPNWGVALGFYLVFMAGFVYFVMRPLSRESRWRDVIFRGAFFGLVTYATYDLTNLATLDQWPLMITTIDLLWGSFICGFTAMTVHWLTMRYAYFH